MPTRPDSRNTFRPKPVVVDLTPPPSPPPPDPWWRKWWSIFRLPSCSCVLIAVLVAVVIAVIAVLVPSWSAPSCQCPPISCPDWNLTSDQCTDPASFTILDQRSRAMAPLATRLSMELLADGPHHGAEGIDELLGLINSHAVSLRDLIIHHTEQFQRLQTTTIAAMADTCDKVCRPYPPYLISRLPKVQTLLSLSEHSAQDDEVAFVHLYDTVLDATLVLHNDIVSSLPSSIRLLNDSLGDAIYEANEAWRKPLPSHMCRQIKKPSCDSFRYYQQVSQGPWMRQLFEALTHDQYELSMSKRDLDHYLAAVNPQTWTMTTPPTGKGANAKSKLQWIQNVGNLARQGVRIGSAAICRRSNRSDEDADKIVP